MLVLYRGSAVPIGYYITGLLRRFSVFVRPNFVYGYAASIMIEI